MAATSGMGMVCDLEVDLDKLKMARNKLTEFNESTWAGVMTYVQLSALEYAIELIDDVLNNCADPEHD